MKQYLKMADVFVGEYKPKRRIDAWPPSRYGETLVELSGLPAQYAVHAINSHDELVEMNKELLAALELMLLIHDEPSGFCGKFGKELDMAIEDQKEKIDTRIAVARNAIAKAKDAS